MSIPLPRFKADMATLRMALRKMHRRACGDESAVYMSIPADRERDADLLLEDALDELAAYRALTDAPDRTARLVAAARALVERINHVGEHPEYRAVWECAQLHRGPYRGPQYEVDFNALADALKEFESESAHALSCNARRRGSECNCALKVTP